MAIDLNPISSGYSTGKINDNFQKVEDELNDNVLRRDGLSPGEANQMEVDLDMNGNAILNSSTNLSESGSLITVGDADSRYVNVTGDTLEGPITMGVYPVYVRIAVEDDEPARKDELDTEIANRTSADSTITDNYQSADANLQSQISGGTPLEASAFSEISWHGQQVQNSLTIPEDKNAWSFGPVMTIASGQAVTISTGSFWTIANGELQ